MRRETQSRPLFYLSTLVFNAAIGLVFYLVTLPPPAYAEPAPLRIIAAMSGTPNRLVVSRLSIDLPVAIGSYDPSSGTWTLGDDSAYYANASVPSNDHNGTTLIYAHARAGLFASLPELTPGDSADVYTSNGHVFHYMYRSVRTVTPDDVSVFTASGAPTLLLQTCTGAWSAYRAMYNFQFVSVGVA